MSPKKYVFLNTHEANMTRLIRFALVLVVLISTSSCNQKTASAPADLLRRGLSGEPSTLDPMAAADNFSYEVLGDLYEGLTAEGPTGEVVPAVAVSWTIDSTGTQYTFHLRSDARWSNGRPVRAQDFVTAWRRVVDPKHASPVADDLRLIAGASAIISGRSKPETLGVYSPSETVLIVTLDEPAPYLPQLLTHAAAYPVYSEINAISRTPGAWISNGPYVLSAWSPGTKVQLTRNLNYWDRAKVHISRVEYQIAAENSQFTRYRAGQLDITDTVPANAISSLKATRPTELVVAPFLATAYYGLNLSTRPFAENIKLRQAIAMAIDRKRLVNALAFGQIGAYSFVPPGTWNYSPQSWQWQELGDAERIAEAKRLYAQAGYTADTPLHLRLLFNSDPVIRNTAIIIANMWKDTLGIDTTLTEEEYRVFLQSRHDKSRWDVARLGWTADYNDASNFLDIFREHSNNNDAGYADASFDAVLDEAARSPDPEKRRKLLEADEEKMLSNYPVVPLYFYVSKRLVKPYVKGFQTNPLNRVESKTLSLLPH